MKKFAYIFPMTRPTDKGLEVVLEWSGETIKSLIGRMNGLKDRDEVEEFANTSSVGSFMKLSTGEMIFRVA